MNRLGFEKYYVQGGDFGALTVQAMAAMYPEKVLGMHSNWCFVFSPLQLAKTVLGYYYPSLVGIPENQEKYMYPLSKKISFLLEESGYFHIQATKPDTVGKCLNVLHIVVVM